MSTPLPTDKDDPGEPLRDVDELVAFFRGAEKPRSRFRVGTEHEKFGFWRDDHRPLPFDGPRGIEELLETIAREEAGWTRAADRGHTIALFHEPVGSSSLGASITLEPGGQFELSGAPLRTIHETCREVGEHLTMLRRVCLPRHIGFIGMGFHPTATWDQMPMVPKNRYEVMQRYMPTVGTRGLDMMKRTATVQANYDWCDEQDFVDSYRAALACAPLVAALFANSPFVEGRPTGALSERQRVWADTDRRRAGFPQAIFDDGFGYERYVQLVLDVPMYFVRRDGLHHDVAGASFRDFMAPSGITVPGLGGARVRATARDWADHLTTVFFEVRAKKIIEVRSADCGPWSRICALPALHKGFLYDATARAEALALMEGARGDELAQLRADIAEHGYRATYRGAPILGRCARLVDIASQGLARIAHKNKRGEDESCFLRPLGESVARGETFAERLLRLHRDKWNGNLACLWDEVEFFHEHETRELCEMDP